MLFYLESLQMDINEKDNAGFSAIHEAVAGNHIQIVEILLEFDADPNAVALDGTRPIHDATESGNIEMCRMLLAYGADLTLNKYSGASIYDLSPNFEIKLFFNAYLRSIGMYYDAMSKQFLHKAGQVYPREELECIIAALQDEPKDVFDGIDEFEDKSSDSENKTETKQSEISDDSGLIIEVYDVLKNEQGSKVCAEVFQTKFEQVPDFQSEMSAAGFARGNRYMEVTQVEKWSKKLKKRNKLYKVLSRDDFKNKDSEFSLRKIKPNFMRNRGKEGLERWCEDGYFRRRRISGEEADKKTTKKIDNDHDEDSFSVRTKRRDYVIIDRARKLSRRIGARTFKKKSGKMVEFGV